MKKLIIVITVLLLCFSANSQKRRLALVIGNANYPMSILANPVNDAIEMEALLKSSGFQVKKYTDLDQSAMKRVIDEFGSSLNNAEVGLFFYAGHGIQANGRNYLIPVDASLKTENDVEYNCVDAGRILARMEDAGTKTNIVILDACRDNPFERSWSRKSTGQGLAFMDAPMGSLIAYSTAPGKTASDGAGNNSPYTSALIQYMKIPNIKIEDFFKKVRVLVREKTKGQQTPWESTSLEGDFYFQLDPDYELQEIPVAAVEPTINYPDNIDQTEQRVLNFEENKKRLAAEIRSIAILPFSNYTGDESNAYFASGIQDALISELGQTGAIRVVSQTSTLFYADFKKTLKEIAVDLNVDAIIETSLISIDDNIRIQLKLYSVSQEELLLWSQTYDSDMSNIMNLYSKVVKNIADEIQLTLSPQQQSQLAEKRQVNPEAYKDYLKGKYFLFSLTREGQKAALDYFQKSVEKDPEYALAYAGMAGAWAILKQMDFVSPDEANPKIEEYLSKALELDSESAEIYFYDAVMKVWTDFDWEGAERSFKRSLEKNPNLSESWAYYSHLLMCLKRPDEMRETMNRAMEIDPYNPLFQILISVELVVELKYDLCINKMSQLQMMIPDNPLVMIVLFQCYAETGQYDLAVNELKKILSQVADEEVIKTLDKEYSKSGFKKALNTTANVLAESSTFISSQQMMLLYGYAGNSDKFLYWLEKAYIRRDPDIPYIGVFPFCRPYQDEPRYIEIMERMKLPLGDFE